MYRGSFFSCSPQFIPIYREGLGVIITKKAYRESDKPFYYIIYCDIKKQEVLLTI